MESHRRRRPESPAPRELASRRNGTVVGAAAWTIAWTIVAGLAHGGSWYFPGWWAGAWAGQAALICLASRFRPSHALAVGWVVGWIGNGWAFSWAPRALQVCLDTSASTAQLLFAGLCAWESVEFSLFCGAASLLLRRGTQGIYFVPAAWVAVEYAWPKIFPWLLADSQLELLPLIQLAEGTGSWGVGFVVTAASAVVGLWLAGGRAELRLRRRYCLAAGLLLSATWAFGEWRLEQWDRATATGERLRVGLVQSDPGWGDAESRLRSGAARLGASVDLLCWPESTLGVYDDRLADLSDPQRTLRMSRNSHKRLRPAESLACDLLAGGQGYAAGTPQRGPYTMSAFLIASDLRILGRYAKRTLLPFGEYVPGEDRLPDWMQLASLEFRTKAGDDPRPLTTSGGVRVGVMLCYEDMFPGEVRQTVRHGAEVLVSLIHGTAFESPLTLEQHRRIAVLRAVENRRYFVRCASTGVSCIVAPSGRIVAELDQQIDATLVASLALHRETTPYAACGDYFPIACLVGLAVFMLAPLRRKRKRPKSESETSTVGVEF